VLAHLYASGFLPEIWVPDEPTRALRRRVAGRNQIVRQCSRLKNIIQSILHSHLIPSCSHADLCGTSGLACFLNKSCRDERLVVERHLREFDRLAVDLKVIPGVDRSWRLRLPRRSARWGASTDRRSSSATSALIRVCGSRALGRPITAGSLSRAVAMADPARIALAGPVVSDPMAGPTELAQLFDVDELARAARS
jgi:transposase